ncbi:type I restriction-modification system S subunit [Streptococcus pneumoniae]|nr:type I restriction-modification system S subunit [Streptococcus pneumoniae]
MKKVKLGEVLSLKKGKKATVLAEQTTLSQRYIQIDDLRNNNNLKFTESLNMTEALPDDILIAWDGANAGTVGYGLSGAVGSTITVLKKNERYKEKIISDYLGVFLESKSQYLRDHSTGATIPHLNKNILLDLQLELLGIEEQENIICILNTIKRLITKRKFQLDELNLLVKSRFNEMFGDVILNEKEWKVSKWNEILTIRNGKNQKQVEDADGKFPIYGSGGIMGYAKDWIVKKNSVIIGRKGNINKPILVRENFWNVDTAFGLEPVLEKINSEYLFYFCQLYNFEKLNKAVTIPSLTKSDLLNISIPLPPLALQNEFADFVALVDKSQLAIQKSLEELETLKETYTDEHLEIMRDNCENLRDLAIIDLLASTGMRVGELVQLNRSDIDFENRECVVFGKGKKERPVYFDARTKIHLRNYLNDRKDSHPALFVTLVGKVQRLGIAGVEIRLRKLGDKLGIQKVHPHKFRRTLATKAIDKGMPIEQVQKLLGHSKIDTTLAYAMVNQNNVKHSHQKFIS